MFTIFMLICTMKSLLINIILFFVSVDTVLASTYVLLHEGEDAYLKYDYDIVNIKEFKLQKGQESAFFKYGQIRADNLNPSQQKRFHVNAWHSESRRFMLVALKVDNAERTDAGTYSCKLIEDGTVVANSTKIISLYVEFPPDPVDCWFLPHTEYERDILQCAAKGGSPPGKITCFQNQKKALPLGLNQEINRTHIQEKFWVDGNLRVSCCSHPDFQDQVQSDTCHDFERSPLHISSEKVTIATSHLVHDIHTRDTPIHYSTSSLNFLNISRPYDTSLVVKATVIPVSSFILIIIIVVSISVYLKMRKNVNSKDQSLGDDDKFKGLTQMQSKKLLSGTEKDKDVKDVDDETYDDDIDLVEITSKDEMHCDPKNEMKDSPKTVSSKPKESEEFLQDDNPKNELLDKEQPDSLPSDLPPCEPPTTTDHDHKFVLID